MIEKTFFLLKYQQNFIISIWERERDLNSSYYLLNSKLSGGTSGKKRTLTGYVFVAWKNIEKYDRPL